MSPEPHAAPNRASETAPAARTVLRTVMFMTRHLQGVIEQLLPVIRRPLKNGWVWLSIRYPTRDVTHPAPIHQRLRCEHQRTPLRRGPGMPERERALQSLPRTPRDVGPTA